MNLGKLKLLCISSSSRWAQGSCAYDWVGQTLPGPPVESGLVKYVKKLTQKRPKVTLEGRTKHRGNI